MYARVLVPLDGSAMAERALSHAQQVLEPGGRLLLVHVVPLDEVPADEGAGRRDHAPAAFDLARAHAYLDNLQREMAGPDVTVATRILEGHPAERIVDAARDADIIVLAAHGTTEPTTSVIAAVADQVVRTAPVPVLLAR